MLKHLLAILFVYFSSYSSSALFADNTYSMQSEDAGEDEEEDEDQDVLILEEDVDGE